MTEYTRFFSAGGHAAHLHPVWEMNPVKVMCGQEVPWYEWYGTGSQAEYEHAAALRTCRRCARAAGADPDAPLRVVMVSDVPGP